MRKLKKALPWIALASALAAAGLLVGGSFYRRTRIVDTGETRAVVEKALNELLAVKPDAPENADFILAFDRFAKSRFVTRVMLATGDFRIDPDSGTAAITAVVSVDGALTREGLVVADIGTLSLEEFSPRQLLLLAVKKAIETRDADHDDVFTTMVRTVRNAAGEPLGAIGVRYDRSPWVNARPDVIWILLIIGFALSFQVYWISVPAWTLLDARERGEKAWVWAAFTLVGNVIALVAYLLARAPRGKSGG
jgi:hypothetical protein